MSRSFFGRLITAGAALGIVISALTFIVSPANAGNLALAASTSGIVPTVTPTVTPTPGTANVTTAAFQTPNLFIFLLVLLVFGFLVIAGLLVYIYRSQQKYYALAQSLNQVGVGVKPTYVHSFETPAKAGEQPKKLKIDGPGYVTVGASATFTAKEEATGNPAKGAHWSITQTDIATISQETGDTVTVSAKKVGSFVLTAKVEDASGTAEASYSAAAGPPQATTEELPFIGQGFGSLVIAVLVLVALILLGVTGVLTGEAVATLLGGLLGYIFGVTTSGGGSAGGAGGAPSKPSGSSPGSSG